MLKRLGEFHDRLTAAGLACAAAFVALIAAAFWYEVVSRYFFSSPTVWAYAVAGYALCPMIFLSMPAMTQRGAHIAICYLVDRLPVAYGRILARTLIFIAAAVCLVCAWICAEETWRQYLREVETISAFPLPKWWISVFIPYGMLLSALHFLRQFAGRAPVPAGADPATS